MRLSPCDLREERLDHVRFGPGLVEHFEQRGKVCSVGVDLEDRLAAIAVQRLDHHRAVLLMERLHIVHLSRNQRRRHEARIIEHEHLFRCVDGLGRVVDDQRLPFEPVEDQGGGDIAQVERRILPHQDDVNIVSEIDLAQFALGEVIAVTCGP